MGNNFMQMLNQVRQNPDQIKQMLYQNGKINKEQFDAIQPMKSFSEIGNYLVNNNLIPNFKELQKQVQSMMR